MSLEVTSIDRGLSRLLEQDKDKLRLKYFFSVFLEQFQELHNAISSVNEKARLVNAVGFVLDRWGVVFNVTRKGMLDDEYRQAIFTKIIIDHSQGTVSDILNAVYLLYKPSFAYLIEYSCLVQINCVEPAASLQGINDTLSAVVASGVNYVVIKEVSNSFKFAECTTESIDFVAKEQSETDIEVSTGASTDIFEVEADSLLKPLDTLGFAEIIVTKTNLGLDDDSIYFVEELNPLEILLTYNDFIIQGGSKFAEVINNG
ncbi:hypothetical protein Trichorick_01375 (plasmid) [Candidatus Trichorickettsia mobilis]|uniref:Uncharacterized protein n=1 Tax=Candidatus Trichorickettsia mobilis TaxID=1346319 RepID=A0ABZ0UXV7_9RICK|nr:hypothetical protein [Candidatus Trichorickettsia mobilis]WPY01462.1 hypothetical protein Trichorick_01375 [Candidatus Trichorickettsia mobilis]